MQSIEITSLLAQQIKKKSQQLDSFFADRFTQSPALFYNSVDIRNSGFKISAVDTNCFPAGFNNLAPISISAAQKQAHIFLEKNFPNTKNILIIPESHTRNLNYLENIRSLQRILESSYNVKIGTLISEITSATEFKTALGNEIDLHPIIKNKDRLELANFMPDVIILNNDLSEGLPQIFDNCSTPIIPSTKIGWYNRSKFAHFTKYNEIATEIAAILEVDPWLISAICDISSNINFKERSGIEDLSQKVENLLAKISQKYQEFNINKSPYCFVKADSGTYGMAVWRVTSASDILAINKKDRNKMSVTKGSIQNTRVIIQEGIPTTSKIDNIPAESMIYMIGGEVMADLFRVNDTRDDLSSLNSAGAKFYDGADLYYSRIVPQYKGNNLSVVNELISKIAALASSQEIAKL